MRSILGLHKKKVRLNIKYVSSNRACLFQGTKETAMRDNESHIIKRGLLGNFKSTPSFLLTSDSTTCWWCTYPYCFIIICAEVGITCASSASNYSRYFFGYSSNTHVTHYFTLLYSWIFMLLALVALVAQVTSCFVFLKIAHFRGVGKSLNAHNFWTI